MYPTSWVTILVPASAGVILRIDAAAGPIKSCPRIRGGDPRVVRDGVQVQRLVPASAGVILRYDTFCSDRCACPRIRGGDPRLESLIDTVEYLSPHPRG